MGDRALALNGLCSPFHSGKEKALAVDRGHAFSTA